MQRYYDVRHVAGESTNIDIDNGVVESATTSLFDRAVVRVLGPSGWGVVSVDNYRDADLDRFVAEALALAELTGETVALADAPHRVLPVPHRPTTRGRTGSRRRPGSWPESRPPQRDLRSGTPARSIPSGTRQSGSRPRKGSSTPTRSRGRATTCSRSPSGTAWSRWVRTAARDQRLSAPDRRCLRREGPRDRARAPRRAGRDGRANACRARPRLAGVFAHEAVGHASEGDLVREGNSVLAGRIGERIGAPGLTIVDDPSLPEFGFDPVDAEGVATTRTESVRDGVINAFLHTRETLAAVGNGLAGHARAMPGEVPLVRMSNTFIENGDATYDECLAECGTGMLLIGSRGGQVDPGRGMFQFNAEYRRIRSRMASPAPWSGMSRSRARSSGRSTRSR